MRNSYLKEGCGFECNTLTRVLPFLQPPKKIHHIIIIKASIFEGRPYKSFILRIILNYQYLRGKDSGFFIAKQVLHIVKTLI
jgi:hypothetical protein